MDSSKPKVKNSKVILMGRSGAGKSSMRQIIFSNYLAKDVRRLATTMGVESSTFNFLGNLTLNIWDCGGQGAYVENYLKDPVERNKVFSGVGVLIYVFDVESREFDIEDPDARDLTTYSDVVNVLAEISPEAKIVALVHKMDLVSDDYKDQVLLDKTEAIKGKSGRFRRTFQCHGTSIWNESLYKAWGSIINSLIPNLNIIESILSHLLEVTGADEVVLFERTTFLKVMAVQSELGEENPHQDRFERLSSIIKIFKASIATYTDTSQASQAFSELYIKTPRFNLIITLLTKNTYALVVLPPGEVEMNCARLNLFDAREQFSNLDGWDNKSARRSPPWSDGVSMRGT